MDTKKLAEAICKKIQEKYSVVIFSSFCDECDTDYVEDEELTKVIEEVIEKNSGPVV